VEALLKALQQSLAEAEAREKALRAELEAVKKDNLRLAEENLKLQAQQGAVVTQPQGQLTKPTPPRTTRPIGSNANLSKVNNQNIGWFD